MSTRVAIVITALAACGRIDFSRSGSEGDAMSTADAPMDETVLIPAGPFMMGCNAALDSRCSASELPYHQVTLSEYVIDRTEVTQAKYDACVAAGACTVPMGLYDPIGTPLLPVRDVDWLQASAYCAWVGKRLPTEAEWEKAARGSDGRTFPWGEADPTCELAVMVLCLNEPEPVGSRLIGASPYGALDMAGNVWEWVSDWWNAGYYGVSPATDPTGPATGTDRASRGGYYGNSLINLRVAIRAADPPTGFHEWLGFRCARSSP